MDQQRDGGGPAFPVLHSIDGNWVKEPRAELSGMSLRDYFAAKAMQSALSLCGSDSRPEGASYCDHVATVSYEMADAMLKARQS